MSVLEPLVDAVKNMTSKQTTVEYPESRESLPDTFRGMLRLDMSTCISCAACERICPNKTITMVEVLTYRGSKDMPMVGHERCLFCALCEEVCPPKCLTLTKNYEDFEVIDKRLLMKRPEELE